MCSSPLCPWLCGLRPHPLCVPQFPPAVPIVGILTGPFPSRLSRGLLACGSAARGRSELRLRPLPPRPAPLQIPRLDTVSVAPQAISHSPLSPATTRCFPTGDENPLITAAAPGFPLRCPPLSPLRAPGEGWGTGSESAQLQPQRGVALGSSLICWR